MDTQRTKQPAASSPRPFLYQIPESPWKRQDFESNCCLRWEGKYKWLDPVAITEIKTWSKNAILFYFIKWHEKSIFPPNYASSIDSPMRYSIAKKNKNAKHTNNPLTACQAYDVNLPQFTSYIGSNFDIWFLSME